MSICRAPQENFRLAGTEDVVPHAHRAISNLEGLDARHAPRRRGRPSAGLSRRVRVPLDPPAQPDGRLPDAPRAWGRPRALDLPGDPRAAAGGRHAAAARSQDRDHPGRPTIGRMTSGPDRFGANWISRTYVVESQCD